MSLASHARAQPQDILDQISSIYPYGTLGELTCTDDTIKVWVAEGGGMAYLERDPSPPTPGSHPFELLARVPVSELGVKAAGLALHPGYVGDTVLNEVDQEDGIKEMLFIAGGRHGFWVLNADHNDALGPYAMRVDDRDADDAVGGQISRRWCNVSVRRPEPSAR